MVANNERIMAEFKEEIIYFVSNIVVLLNKHLNRQRFYTQHSQEVISLAVTNQTGDVVATGELSAQKPAIHIWNCRTLVNYNVLQGIHAKGVHLLAFSADDKFLISCGLQVPSAVIIYDWVSGSIIISASISSPTIDLLVLRAESHPTQVYQEEDNPALVVEKPKPVQGYVILSAPSLIVFEFAEKMVQYRMIHIPLSEAGPKCSAAPLAAMTILADYRNCYYKLG